LKGEIFMLKPKKILPFILSTLLLLQNFPIISAFAEQNNYSSSITSRLAGADRYATSIAISKSGWEHANNVIISTGSNFPDALSASALSKSKDAPIILINKDFISTDAIAELKRLNVSNAYIIGGIGVISASVENQLKSLNISITRFAGTDRYDTSAQIANYVGVNNGIIIATGTDFPDALSVAPISAMKSMPILLSQKSGLDPNMSAFIKDKNIPVSYIIGGTGVLDSSMDASLPNSKRLSGNDRFGTNLSINNQFATDLSFHTVYLATGLDFPDALSGSALAAKNNAPIILTDKASISTDIINLMKNKNVKQVVILGGTGVVSQAVEDDVNAKVKVNVTSISLNKSSETLSVGDSYNMIASILPLNATNQSVTWSSSNSSVASVDSNGKVTAVSAGTATITAKTVDGNKTDTCNVVVVVNVTSISLNKSSETFTVGCSDTIIATVSPLNATNQSVTWLSSNSSVATVDSNGKVTAVSVGTASITAKTVDGSKTDTCNVIVLSDRTGKGEQVVFYATCFRGTPYVWGTTGPNSFDASGFTQYVYAHFGIEIGRTTYSQITNGYEVPKEQLQLGDLVFFGTNNSPHHVGIYVGYGQYIHAPRTGDFVKVSSLSGRSDFFAARRIFN